MHPIGDSRRVDASAAPPGSPATSSSTGPPADPAVLPELQRALLAGGGAITVAVHDGSTITAAWPGLHDRAYGIAFDVGSTTVAGHLCDLLAGDVLASAGA